MRKIQRKIIKQSYNEGEYIEFKQLVNISTIIQWKILTYVHQLYETKHITKIKANCYLLILFILTAFIPTVCCLTISIVF